MKALTIAQPFASLIATGEKRVENRTWPAPYRGPVAIHAGLSRKWLGDVPPAGLPFGAVVAVVGLAGCVTLGPAGEVPPEAAARWPWLDAHEHTEGPVCWVLGDVTSLREPVPCKGALGLWRLPEGVLAAVRAQLGLTDKPLA